MRTASILLALIVLGCCREAEAVTPEMLRIDDYTIRVGQQHFGFIDVVMGDPGKVQQTDLCLGPLGSREVPFTATQGLLGFCLILALLIVLPAVFTVRWKRKRGNNE